jgi:hypothetical protein
MTSDDGTIDATVEEPVASEAPQEDVAEVPADSIETPEKGTETADTNAISDADLVQIDKFSKLVESDRIDRIQNLLTSGRKDQVATAKVLMEAFDLEVEEKSAPDVDEAVAESLRKIGLTPESIKELREKKEDDEKKEAVKSWAEQLGLKPSEILRNKDFVKAFHSKDSDDVSGKVDFAIKAYLKNNSVSSQAKQKATLKLSTTGKSTAASSSKGRSSIEELLGGKSLDEIDLTKF